MFSPALEQTLPSSPPVIRRDFAWSSVAESNPSWTVSVLWPWSSRWIVPSAKREMRDAAKENGGDAVAIEIKRGDGRHESSKRQVAVLAQNSGLFNRDLALDLKLLRPQAAWQASKVRFSFSASSSRPMKTSRLSCFSPSFQARWWSPSMSMCTPWMT